jgi:hypothetical protein
VTKLNPTGSAMIYSTLLSGTQGSSASSGTNASAANAIAIDGQGHAFIAGSTNDTDFPVTTGVVQPTNKGVDDGIVAELTADGSGLVFSTYLGASDYEGFFGIKLDRAGNIWLGGFSSSRDLLEVEAIQNDFGGFIDCWVAELTGDGRALLFSSYLGGADQETIYGMALQNNQLYLAGRTASDDFPVTASAAQPTYGGGIWDNFLTILNIDPLALTVNSITRSQGGEINITGQATPLSSVKIQVSSDLTDSFTTLQTVSADENGVFQFTDSDSTRLWQRFYHPSYR